jgi:hypothetical protein
MKKMVTQNLELPARTTTPTTRTRNPKPKHKKRHKVSYPPPRNRTTKVNTRTATIIEDMRTETIIDKTTAIVETAKVAMETTVKEATEITTTREKDKQTDMASREATDGVRDRTDREISKIRSTTIPITVFTTVMTQPSFRMLSLKKTRLSNSKFICSAKFKNKKKKKARKSQLLRRVPLLLKSYTCLNFCQTMIV